MTELNMSRWTGSCIAVEGLVRGLVANEELGQLQPQYRPISKNLGLPLRLKSPTSKPKSSEPCGSRGAELSP